jgi:SMC interacting uncharacterized protein involved in chromosome segregation
MDEAKGNNAQVMHSIGQLTGAVQSMNQALTTRIEDIRQDIKRIEVAQTERLNHVESNLSGQIGQLRDDVNKRIDSLGVRVTSLEAEDKRLIEKTAKTLAVGGSVGIAMSAAIVELIKRM